MFKKIAIGVAILFGVLIVVIANQPDTFHVERATLIGAPAEVVFANVNALEKWTAWSPWEKRDPDMQRTYGGPATGVGAIYSWSGNKEVGSGRMTIIESLPAEKVRIRLEFFAPWEGTNDTIFTFVPHAGATLVTWRMDGAVEGLMAKAFHMVMDMDGLIGADYDKGLAALKERSEADAKVLLAEAASNSVPLDEANEIGALEP
jgi:hypothetical protein